MTIKIMLAEDHQIVRQGLRNLLASEPDIQVVAEADNGRLVLPRVKEFAPHLVIMDITMPGLNGIEATRQIQAECPGVKVIALSMHSDSLFVLNMLKAGASGYLLKDCALEDLVRAIRTVMGHKTYLSPGISDVVIKDFVSGWDHADRSGAFSVLTAREREVLQLMAEGKSTTQIADCLCVSVKTVESHRKQIMSKSGIRSVAELTKYAIRQGLTSLEE
ncbi:MAG: response regulator [Desulfobaccales bacterium]